MGKRVTITMIAEACNTSIGTVDRALNGRSGINPETRSLILETAKAMGYRHTPKAKQTAYRIAVVDFGQNNDFHQILRKGVEQARQELRSAGFQVDFYTTEHLSAEEQLSVLAQVAEQKYDGVLINSLGDDVDERINAFSQSGVAVATFNTDSPNSKRLFYVGCDPNSAGRLSGELVGKMAYEGQTVLVVGNFARKDSFIQRFSGFCEVIQQEFPKLKLLSQLSPYQCAGEAEAEIARMIEREPRIDYLYVTDHSGTVGATHALKKLGRKDIRLVGYDLCNDICAALREGWCTAVMFQDPLLQGYQAVKLMARHLETGWLPDTGPHSSIVPRIVMKYNSEAYDGYEMARESIL